MFCGSIDSQWSLTGKLTLKRTGNKSLSIIRLGSAKRQTFKSFVSNTLKWKIDFFNTKVSDQMRWYIQTTSLWEPFESYTSKNKVNALVIHDDVIIGIYFPRYWPFVGGIHQSPVNSPHKGQWRGALLFSLICVCINGWVNNDKAGDLRRYHAHYYVIVMKSVNMDAWCTDRQEHTSLKFKSHSQKQLSNKSHYHGLTSKTVLSMNTVIGGNRVS